MPPIRMATFGNHEIDFGADVLRQRMKEIGLTVGVEPGGRDGKLTGRGGAETLCRMFVSFRVGFIGLIKTTQQMVFEELSILCRPTVSRGLLHGAYEGAGDRSGTRWWPSPRILRRKSRWWSICFPVLTL